jgi:hypothetical protein
MNRKFAAMALCGCLASGSAGAQTPRAGQPPVAGMPAAPSPTAAPATGNAGATPDAPRTYSGADLPGPTRYEDLKPVSIALPDDPLEPYVLTKEHGPFMVLAKVFRGPDSEKMALALCKELRQDFQLPAYILRSKEFPMKSYIRGTPVQAPSVTTKSAIKQPEQIRIHDEAAVLVGNEKTLQGSEELLHQIKKLKPKCLGAGGIPELFKWREGGGLHRAIRTTNPYVPAQWLYPKAPDRLMLQMNSGLRSIANCPGHFTIQVASFSGRSGYDVDGQMTMMAQKIFDAHTSPLKTAAADAEHLADKLMRTPEIQRLGQPVYVYHDRTSSKVYVGSFKATDDAAAYTVHEELVKAAGKYNSSKKKDWLGRSVPVLDQMIVPATMLTSVDDIKAQMHGENRFQPVAPEVTR